MENAALDLVNSDRTGYLGPGTGTDRLADPAWVAEFLARWGLGAPGPYDEAARSRLAGLRRLLGRVVDAIAAGGEPAAADLAGLNAVLAAAPVRRVLVCADGGYRLVAEPLTRDWAWVLAEIAHAFAHLLTEHDPTRLHTCDNADCRWAFYDTSRSRTRRFCDSTSCGNLVKVRRFRERHRHRHPRGEHASETPDSGA